MKQEKPLLECGIKMYHIDREDDAGVYTVFSALARERVFLPVNRDGNMVSLSTDMGNVIAVFSSPDRLGDEEGIELREVYLRDYIDGIMRSGMHILINPFSPEDCQFIVPNAALEKMLLPLIQRKEDL